MLLRWYALLALFFLGLLVIEGALIVYLLVTGTNLYCDLSQGGRNEVYCQLTPKHR